MTGSFDAVPRRRRGQPLPVRLVPPPLVGAAGAAPTTGTGGATASLVLGIVSLVLDVLLVPTVLAIVLGAVALGRGTPARARAIGGIVLGVLGVGTQTLLVFAVALPALHGLQLRALDATAESALTNDATALNGWATAHHGHLPKAVDPAALVRYGWDDSTAVRSVAYRRSGDAFCLVGAGTTGSAFTVTTHRPVLAAASCPAKPW